MNAPHETFELFHTDHASGRRRLVGQGTWGSVADHLPNSRTIKQKLQIINDAAHAEGKLLEIRKRERELVADRAALDADRAAFAEAQASMLADSIAKLDDRAKRMDSLEAKIGYADLPPSPED